MYYPDHHDANRSYFAITKRETITTLIILGSIIILLLLALPAKAGERGELQKYFSDAAVAVKATDNPTEKRAILNETFQTMFAALEMAQKSELISKNDAVGINRFRAALQEKQDELAGHNGYVRVPDAQLNAFSEYVVQDTEQADQFITISVVTLLLIIILVVLLV
ncbi:MAG: hypothetical protein H6Q30_1709 [Bacteroidetes bacterium]|jgi:uncharacterized integral membrane protein|nr:hypothetical protein [Bacteroidota bacterium]